MYGVVLLIPFFLIRFGLLKVIHKDAVRKAAYFAPMQGKEYIAYWIYQLSNIAFFILVSVLPVYLKFTWSFVLGGSLLIAGCIACAISMIDFAKPSKDGMQQTGIYRISRNPMYLSYFLYFTSCALLTRSWYLFGIVLIFQISSHWIILAEERWCLEQFQDAYRTYMEQVPRYIKNSRL